MFYETPTTTADLLAEWRWLIGGHPIQVGWSLSGDLFFTDREGRVCRLDTGGGDVEVVAESHSDFHQQLSDPARADEILLTKVVQSYEAHHGKLGEGRCLGFIVLPVLGGTYSDENRRAINIAEHAGFTGDVFRQIRDLPDGTKVRFQIDP
jgi:hypothetical protein